MAGLCSALLLVTLLTYTGVTINSGPSIAIEVFDLDPYHLYARLYVLTTARGISGKSGRRQ